MALAVYNGELYAGGIWLTLKKYVGGIEFAAWEDVGGHFSYYVQDMLVDTINNFLYVSGGFGIVDDTILSDAVAIWDGFNWTAVGGHGEGNHIIAMALYRGDLYTNTGIDTIGGVYTGYLAKWDGSEWSPGVPGGIKFGPLALAVYDDMLYIGGSGPIDGSLYCPIDTARKTLARWYLPPATNCNYLKPRVQTYADTFYLVNDTVTVQFYNNNAYVDTWDWDFGDLGTDNVKDPSHIYTDTGTYNVCVTVNDTGCIKTACKDITIASPLGISEFETQETGFKIYPNPTDGNFIVETELPMTTKFHRGDFENTEIKITGLTGQTKTVIPIRSNKTVINTKGWQNGTYICNLYIDGKFVKSEKIILSK